MSNVLSLAPLFRQSVGFDRFNDLFESALRSNDAGSSYPPYNVEKHGEDHYRIVVAAAGFEEDDLELQVERDVLTVVGNGKIFGDSIQNYSALPVRRVDRIAQLANFVGGDGFGAYRRNVAGGGDRGGLAGADRAGKDDLVVAHPGSAGCSLAKTGAEQLAQNAFEQAAHRWGRGGAAARVQPGCGQGRRGGAAGFRKHHGLELVIDRGAAGADGQVRPGRHIFRLRGQGQGGPGQP